jgi:hypothetical protein
LLIFLIGSFFLIIHFRPQSVRVFPHMISAICRLHRSSVALSFVFHDIIPLRCLTPTFWVVVTLISI